MRNPIIAWAARDEVKQAAMTIPAARELVSSYVAGEIWEDLARVLATHDRQGLASSVEYLGVRCDRDGIQRNLDGYLTLVDDLARHGHTGVELSIRLTQLGLTTDSDVDQLTETTRCIVRAAVNADLLPILDMSSAAGVDATLEVWTRIRQDFPSLGVTIQAGLHRSRRDLEMVALPGARVRLCKGSYRESRLVAFQSAHEVDLAFVRGLRRLMTSQATVLVATHDPFMIEITEALAARHRRTPQNLEFQMLKGIRPLELRRLADIGFTARSYVPFGPGWYEYYLHSFAGRWANAALFARSVVRKK